MSTYSMYGAWFALRLLSEGHKVDIFLSEPKYADILSGIVPRPKILDIDRRKIEAGFPGYGKYDLSLFDLTGRSSQADFSALACPTIGDGSFHGFLEEDRMGGIKIMEGAEIEVPPYEEFSDVGAAKAHIAKTGKRFVYKPNGGQDQDPATTYVAKDAEDLLGVIDKIFVASKGVPFILQEFIPGIEVSVEGWFNGEDFYLLNATLETKKFMNEDKGAATGCSGNIVFTINPMTKIYTEGLCKMKETLQIAGFRGMIDLNAIVTDSHLYGLEWTPRFGYDASATLVAMYGGNYGEMLHAIATGNTPDLHWRAPFGVSSRISIAPYPTEIKVKKVEGIPIKGIDPESMDELLGCYLFDVKEEGGALVCAGHTGFIGAPVAIGADLKQAFEKLDADIGKINIPDMQYRTDIKTVTSKRYLELKKKGWI
jgi:phosphoribosylamine-glycine ligase